MRVVYRAMLLTGLLGLACLPFAACSGNGGEEDAGVDAHDGNGGDPGPTLCTSIAECPAGHLCLGGFCEPGQICTSDDDCDTGFVCNVIKEVCVPEEQCELDDDCQDAAIPHCMVSAGMCVACLNDGHCTGTPATPHCKGDGTCVACTQDAHCLQEQFCNEEGVCEDDAPDCTEDADCPGQHCDTQAGKCYDCVTNDHCTGGFVCEPGTHRCVECYEDMHCTAPRNKCKRTTFACVECLEDTDCPAGQHCNVSSGACTDVICTSDADCTNEPGRPKCHVATGDCVQCLTHGECGLYQWCRDQSCQSGCATDQECEDKVGEDYHCDVPSGDCFYAECLEEADCSDNAERPHCKTAASPSNPPQYSCVECVEDAHCDEFFECSPTEFTCRPMPCYKYADPDTQCRQIDPCYYCNFANGNCEPTYDCPIGDECCSGFECNSFAHCELDLDCNAAEPECASGYECNTTTHQCTWLSCCDPACGSGEYCDSDCHCQSGCHEAGDTCDPFSQNCCQGLLCNIFWPFCT